MTSVVVIANRPSARVSNCQQTSSPTSRGPSVPPPTLSPPPAPPPRQSTADLPGSSTLSAAPASTPDMACMCALHLYAPFTTYLARPVSSVSVSVSVSFSVSVTPSPPSVSPPPKLTADLPRVIDPLCAHRMLATTADLPGSSTLSASPVSAPDMACVCALRRL
jgi:hypothetical protein